MFLKGRKYNARLFCGAAAVALSMAATAAAAEGAPIAIAPQPLASALGEFASQTRRAVLITPDLTASRVSREVAGETDPEAALTALLQGTGLTYRRDGDTFLIVQGGSEGPQSAGAGGDVDALIVTAQKREENIQDVPIAISAFSQEELTNRQVAGGPDLMTQVPNMTFTKTNFSSYSIQIRGIGTQAISATTDAAVAVAFNNTPFIRNRFFEQEFYDLQRVEVLRGPQGTLYGRNATAGVVNIISAKPKFRYEAKAAADVANYSSSRLEGMINLPLVDDVAALRLAGAWTKRDGYAINQITGNPIDGRDLWSTRVSLRLAPTEALDVNLIWEHFEEDDDRLRSGKQLCHTHEVTSVAGFPTGHFDVMAGGGQEFQLFNGVQATFSQGCAPASLYATDSFQTPNGLSLPYYAALSFGLGLPAALADPYVSRTQSTDLRVIESTVDPQYKAQSDLVELQVSYDLGNGVALSSETSYSTDTLFSTQDFNRFNTATGAWFQDVVSEAGPNGAVFCDPQVGCSDRLVAVDLSTAKSSQFSQEFRLSSDFDGPFNFSAGANFLRYDTEDKYYVFINSLTFVSAGRATGRGAAGPYVPGVSDNSDCLRNGQITGDPGSVYTVIGCVYIDPNPIGSLNDKGHNYFLSKNPYKLISYAVFGEAYYNVTDTLKITGGLRWTVDKKEAPRIPSWLLASETIGYPVAEVIEQEWRKPTGRLTVDWKPDLAFTDETLVYGSFAHGYKAGGTNPPNYTFVFFVGDDQAQAGSDQSSTRPKTFEPEYVNAFELGAKNTFADGAVTLNLAAFYYDYKGYQISEIVDRSAFNRNFDADVWGLEIEADWRPLENLRLGFKGGYENTRIADGERAVDLMDRTAGVEGWKVVAPFPTFASNCILPEWIFVGYGDVSNDFEDNPTNILVNPGGIAGGNPSVCEIAYIQHNDPVTWRPYVANPTEGDTYFSYYPDYPGWDPRTAPNNGEGFDKELGGKELPNAPNFTATITADYTIPLPADWLVTLHTDLYYQSEAWTRVFNTEGYDKLKAYTNVNLAAIFTNDEAGWRVMAYVKNVFDRDSITGAFLNSDDVGLTTNVFLTEPRLYGIRVTKDWTGGPWWTGANPDHPAGEPYPLTVELSGAVQRHDAPYRPLRPSFADAFGPDLEVFDASQNGDLDWGDGRGVKLTYRPAGSQWWLSAGVRYGRANGGGDLNREAAASEGVCPWPAAYVDMIEDLLSRSCNPASPDYDESLLKYPTNIANASVWNLEEHQIVDFSLGKDMGLGGLGGSSIAAGFRYAKLNSSTDLSTNGIPNWNLPEGWVSASKYPTTHDDYFGEHKARREFEGAGPVVTWAGDAKVLGEAGMAGEVAVEWSAGGGVLFGKQRTTIKADERYGHFSGGYYYDTIRYGVLTDVQTSSVTTFRTESVSVPVVDLSLGLSYEVQRVKIAAGYRWERYFDAIDGGYAEERSFDRTIDGPYFKVSVGFGG